MNRVEIRGGLTRDPELRYTPGGMPVVEMSVAVNGARWSSQERQQIVTTVFVSVQAFGWLAEEIATEEFSKGDEVYVLGELDQRTVEKQDGTKETKTRVTASTVIPTRRRFAGTDSPTPATGPVGEEPF